MKITLIDFLLSMITTGSLQQLLEMIIFILRLQEKLFRDGSLLAGAGSLFIILILKNKINLTVFSELLHNKNEKCQLFAVFFMLFAGAAVFRLKKFGVEEGYYFQSAYFICVLICLLNDWQKSKADTERKLAQVEKNKQFYEAYDELRTLVRERQHDMDNHISAILGMVYTIDDREELIRSQQAYCRDLKEGHEEIKLFLSVENRLIAGFLYMKIQKAMENQIKMTNRIVFKEQTLAVSEYSFIEITGILLDNAIEALAKSRETIRKIQLEIVNDKEALSILVANSSRPLSTAELAVFFQEDYTSKGVGRGIGLKKLSKMVHAMGGKVIAFGEPGDEGWFVKFEVVIPKN